MPLFGHDQNHRPDGQLFDTRIFQGTEPTCAIRSQQIILRDFGIQIPQDELTQYSTDMGWYGNGTPVPCIGNLLEACGVHTHVCEGATVADLVSELNAGHRVLITVDAKELWADPDSEEYEFYHGLVNPNHALVVAGLKIDPYNPRDVSVILCDPGPGHAYISYPLEKLHHAWGDGNFYMLATDEAAPYQYNEVSGKMEFSNFATEYTVSEFPFHNEFSDIYEIANPDGYNYIPYYWACEGGRLPFDVEDMHADTDCEDQGYSLVAGYHDATAGACVSESVDDCHDDAVDFDDYDAAGDYDCEDDADAYDGDDADDW